ncbi:MAG TPA: HIT domain-containing protein [Candidatus Absconditabacterales bacterium]|nr:HIT domain-containing protein [Candidatus Absconditabacterales bacterium]
MSEKSIFTRIAEGEIPAAKIREDEQFFAILDLFPTTRGMTLVIPKKQIPSDIFLMDDLFYSDYLLATKKVVEILKKGFGVSRVGAIIEGMEINHAHIKLYPLRGVGEERKPMTGGPATLRFDIYPGYMQSGHGPQQNLSDLQSLADEIISKNK